MQEPLELLNTEEPTKLLGKITRPSTLWFRIGGWLVEVVAEGKASMVTSEDVDNVFLSFVDVLKEQGMNTNQFRERPDAEAIIVNAFPLEGDFEDEVLKALRLFGTPLEDRLIDEEIEPTELLKRAKESTEVFEGVAKNILDELETNDLIEDTKKVITEIRANPDTAQAEWVKGIRERYDQPLAYDITSADSLRAIRKLWREKSKNASADSPFRTMSLWDFFQTEVEPSITPNGVVGVLIDEEEKTAEELLRSQLAFDGRLPATVTDEWLTEFNKQKRLLSAEIANRKATAEAQEAFIDALETNFDAEEFAQLQASATAALGDIPSLVADHATRVPTSAESAAVVAQEAAEEAGKAADALNKVRIEQLVEERDARAKKLATEQGRRSLFLSMARRAGILQEGISDEGLVELERLFQESEKQFFIKGEGFEEIAQGLLDGFVQPDAPLTPEQEIVRQRREAAGPPPGGVDVQATADVALKGLKERIGPNKKLVERQQQLTKAEAELVDAQAVLETAGHGLAPTSIDYEHALGEAQARVDTAQTKVDTLREQERQLRNDKTLAWFLSGGGPEGTQQIRSRIGRAFATGDPSILEKALKSEGVLLNEELTQSLLDQQATQFPQGVLSSGASGEGAGVLQIGVGQEPLQFLNIKRDEQGQQIFKTDAQGQPILDEDGQKIPVTEFVPLPPPPKPEQIEVTTAAEALQEEDDLLVSHVAEPLEPVVEPESVDEDEDESKLPIVTSNKRTIGRTPV